MGVTYDIGDYEQALDLVLDAAGYEDLAAGQAGRRGADGQVQLGLGVSLYVEVTAGPRAGGGHARVVVESAGSATVYTGSSSHGQGHHTAFTSLVSERLGIAPERITIVHGDTDQVERGAGTMGSRSLQLGGSAIHEAAGEVIERALPIAARLLDTRSEEHKSELQSLMRDSYAVFCVKKKQSN